MPMMFMGHKITIHKLGLKQTTDDGAYYCKVDGENVGEKDRPFWNDSVEATACAKRYIIGMKNT